MQRHALVKYFKFATRTSTSGRRVPWLITKARWLGLLPSPPMQDGRAVEPVVGGDPVPSLRYFGKFVAWRVYTSPRQINVELAILVLEMAVVWGVLGPLLAKMGVTNNALEPLLRSNNLTPINAFNPVRTPGDYEYTLEAKPPPAVSIQRYLVLISLTVNGAAVASVLVYWVC